DDGLHAYISIKFPIRHADETVYGVCGISTDITERKRAEEQARQHQEQLSHVSRVSLMGVMAAGLAHELNQPLTAIANFASGSLHHLRSDHPDVEAVCDTLARIAAMAERAGRIIHGISDMERKRPPR